MLRRDPLVRHPSDVVRAPRLDGRETRSLPSLIQYPVILGQVVTGAAFVALAFLLAFFASIPMAQGQYATGGIEGFDRVEVTVINRWGQEVYHNVEYRNDWDGANLRGGTFYYQIRTFAGRQSTTHSGWVLLKRH